MRRCCNRPLVGIERLAQQSIADVKKYGFKFHVAASTAAKLLG
jgi:hypothetical protein